LLHFTKKKAGGAAKAEMTRISLDSPDITILVAPGLLDQALHDLDLLDVAGNPYTRERFLAGAVTPVFFASALTNFGIENFFDAFVEMAPPPSARPITLDDGTESRLDPITAPFSAYVFKLQANMNPRHRDSTAFFRVCSGRFERGMVVTHHRLGTQVRLTRPHSLVAQERTTLDEAYPGDIVGVVNSGQFAIGDTISLTDGFRFKPLPQFQPEVFGRISPKDVGKRKAFDKGMHQMAEEGTVQILRNLTETDWYIGAVGRLQFDVLVYRLKHEYGVDTTLENLPFECSAWLQGDPETFRPPFTSVVVKDRLERIMVLFPNLVAKRYAQERHPHHAFVDMA
jgi:peptide chain release factor 3